MTEQPFEVTSHRRIRQLEQELARLRQTQQSPAAGESVFEMVVQAANSVILLLDPKGRITFINDFGIAFFGFAPEELLGRSAIETIVPEQDRNGTDLALLIESLVREPERFAVNENENVKKSGERAWIAWTNRAVRDEDGRVRQIICIGNDITAHKEAERQLEETTRQLQERVKELNCLYEISRLRDLTDFSLDDSLQAIVDLIPKAFEFPESACARLLLEGYEIATENFKKTDWRMSQEIRVGAEKVGNLEVCYLEPRFDARQEQFMAGEHRLLNAIAERVGKIIEREWMEEDLRRLR